MNQNPLINPLGDFCVQCGQPTQRNFASFDTLPLVEFTIEGGIAHEKVMQLLKMDPPEDPGARQVATAPRRGNNNANGWNENQDTEEQTMTFNDDPNDALENDLFTERMLQWMDTQTSPEQYRPVEVSDRILKSMRYEEVFVVDLTHFCPNLPKKYYKNMVPDVAIARCEKCCKFFIQDEYEFAYMELGYCPFCRNVEKDKGPKAIYGSLADML